MHKEMCGFRKKYTWINSSVIVSAKKTGNISIYWHSFINANKLTVHYLKPGAHKLNLLQLSYKHKTWILRKAYAINLL